MVYFAQKGAPFDLILFVLLALVLFPILGSKSKGLTGYVAGSLRNWASGLLSARG